MEGLCGNSVCEEKARRHVAKLTLNVNFIVYFTYFRENVVVIICTNINYILSHISKTTWTRLTNGPLDRRSNCCNAV